MKAKENTNNPLFSVVTVTFNAATVITPTIASIEEQTCGDYEWLVIDGVSRDETLRLVEEAAVEHKRVVSEPDRGLYDAMNKAITLAEGSFLIWLNAGDAFAAPDVLQRLHDAATAHPDAGVLYGQTMLVDTLRHVTGPRHLTAPTVLTADSFRNGMLVCHQAFVARRDLMPQYDMRYRFSADYDWCIKVLRRSTLNVYLGDEPLIHFLDDSDGTTAKNRRASLLERFRAMRRHYGLATAILRHLAFIPRVIKRKFAR